MDKASEPEALSTCLKLYLEQHLPARNLARRTRAEYQSDLEQAIDFSSSWASDQPSASSGGTWRPSWPSSTVGPSRDPPAGAKWPPCDPSSDPSTAPAPSPYTPRNGSSRHHGNVLNR